MIYRTNFKRTNFCFDPPVKQSLDIVFESDVPQDDDHLQEMIDAAWDALCEQYPSWSNEADPFPIKDHSGWSSVLGGRKIELVEDKDLDYDLGEPGIGRPRLAEIFKKKGWDEEKFQSDREACWRVTGFYKTWVSPRADRSKLSKQDREMAEMTDDIMVEILAEERAEMTPSQLASKNREIKIIPCSREEAEFVSGCGVAGCILRLQDLIIIGRAKWDDRSIARERRDYNPDRTEWPTTWHKYWER